MTRSELDGKRNAELVARYPDNPIQQKIQDVLSFYFKRRHNLTVTYHTDVPQVGPYLGLFNHNSILDMAMLMGADRYYPRSIGIVKESMVKAPIIGPVILERMWKTISVKRDGSDGTAARNRANEVFDEGRGIVFAPEGTRSKTRHLNPMDASAVEFIVKAAERGVSVFAIGISGTAEALPKGRIIPKKEPITVQVGPTLDFSRWFGRRRLSRSEREEVALYIREKMMELLPEKYHPLPDTPAIWSQKDYVERKPKRRLFPRFGDIYRRGKQ